MPSIPTLPRLSANEQLWVGGSSIRPISVAKWVNHKSFVLSLARDDKKTGWVGKKVIRSFTDKRDKVGMDGFPYSKRLILLFL